MNNNFNVVCTKINEYLNKNNKILIDNNNINNNIIDENDEEDNLIDD